jgi:5'-nucleotidase
LFWPVVHIAAHKKSVKHILYIDLDGPIVNFESGINRLSPETQAEYAGRLDEVPGIFGLMEPTDGAIAAYEQLAQKFDTYILSTAPWGNPSAWSDKIGFVQRYLPVVAHKRLILSHHKNLNHGDYLIDDRPNNGASEFTGVWIQYGSGDFPDWGSILGELL